MMPTGVAGRPSPNVSYTPCLDRTQPSLAFANQSMASGSFVTTNVHGLPPWVGAPGDALGEVIDAAAGVHRSRWHWWCGLGTAGASAATGGARGRLCWGVRPDISTWDGGSGPRSGSISRPSVSNWMPIRRGRHRRTVVAVLCARRRRRSANTNVGVRGNPRPGAGDAPRWSVICRPKTGRHARVGLRPSIRAA